jgi:hypothetical protein
MVLLFIGGALLMALAVLLFRRKGFPFFFIYVLFSILTTLVLIAVESNYLLYFKVYWITELIQAPLTLLALYEAFHAVFIDDYRDLPWFWMVFPGAVIVLTIISILITSHNPAAQASPLTILILSFETVVNWVLGCLFMMFLVLAWILIGESWPTFPYGVVTGFAAASAGSLAAYWLRSIFGTKLNWMGKYGPPLAYILGVLIWIASCYLPEEPRRRFPGLDADPARSLASVRQYMRALKWIAGKR